MCSLCIYCLLVLDVWVQGVFDDEDEEVALDNFDDDFLDAEYGATSRNQARRGKHGRR